MHLLHCAQLYNILYYYYVLKQSWLARPLYLKQWHIIKNNIICHLPVISPASFKALLLNCTSRLQVSLSLSYSRCQTVLISGKTVTSRFFCCRENDPLSVPPVSTAPPYYWTLWESQSSRCGNPCWKASPCTVVNRKEDAHTCMTYSYTLYTPVRIGWKWVVGAAVAVSCRWQLKVYSSPKQMLWWFRFILWSVIGMGRSHVLLLIPYRLHEAM